ncbi:hypothetical protein KBI52_20660 [Microvirga sp. HBU67558]|uniref:hypothetical protein n=1 Tax=Microvirga TaxID=186650 RepID=UPI001B3735E9|nr:MULTISPECIES: hypothetical protein [unclassified Microvirga]MBQ0822602.1 hypothetical protein [Microvirga sp. HBU67558]
MYTKAIVERACVDYPFLSDLCAAEIERRIIQAYVQLVFRAVDRNSSRAIAVLRLGSLEVHLTELHPAHPSPDLPPFWIEVIDAPTQSSVDSLGFHDFDEDELAAAVEMIVSAAHNAGHWNGPSPRGPAT